MTTPGGVPNLPQGALTLDTLAPKLQDMSGDAMKSRAVERFPSIFNNSTGLDPALDITPFGILTRIWAEVNSLVANSDPADIQGPEDLPALLLEFIEGLPVIGQLVGLLEAILGTYDGDDETLLTIQAIFAPIRAIVDALTAVSGGTGGLANFFPDLLGLFGNPTGLGTGSPTLPGLSSIPLFGPLLSLFGGASNATQAGNFFTNLLSFLGTPTLTGSTGSFDPTATATDFINNILNPTGLLASLTGIVDAIFEAITGTARDGAGDPIFDLQTVLQNIPFLNVLGVGGPGNIGGSVTGGWDQLIGGFVGTIGSGASLADLFNVGQTISSRATLGQFSWDILGIRSNKSLNTGFLPTSESNISLDKVALAGSAPTVGVTQSTALTTFIRISEAASKGAVSWQGSGVTNVTHAFVNIFKMDTTTGDMVLVHNSANIVGSLSGSMAQVIYELPTPIDVQPSDVYGIEVAVRGIGTHSIAGASTWLPDQQVYPRRFSSVRNSGTTTPPLSIDTASVVYSSNVPFVEFAVSAGNVAIPHTPQTTQFNTPGTSTIAVPDWANYVEVMALGGGGGGHQGGTFGVGGAGGDNGSWFSNTWVRGTDFVGTPSISVSVAAGGTGGSGNGDAGGNTTVSITGHSITGVGGAGADSLDVLGGAHSGQSPGSFTHNGVTYVGGVQQDTYGGNGAAPGGGGAGGNWISFQPGGNGAPGAAWIRFRQS